VFEEQPNPLNAIGGATKCMLRNSPSKDINGNTISGTGFGYFPGYAIDLETGERLNIAFGEDSYYGPSNGYPSEHGQDMLWNPTSTFTTLAYIDTAGISHFNYVLGDKHVVYVFAHNNIIPAYDSCQTLASKLQTDPNHAWGSCMWVGYTMLSQGEQLLSNKATVRIRMAKPYERYQTEVPSVNNDYPMYRFSTCNLVPTTNDLETAKNALSTINIVPNPYYAFSSYEKNQLDNRVKIINLPAKCTVSIYTPAGILIRKFNRDVSSDNTSGGIASQYQENLETALDWDLKNSAAIPIASGVYIIHVEAPGIGEKTIKWFGVLRPIDLDTF